MPGICTYVGTGVFIEMNKDKEVEMRTHQRITFSNGTARKNQGEKHHQFRFTLANCKNPAFNPNQYWI
jgi:hypothetical protein